MITGRHLIKLALIFLATLAAYIVLFHGDQLLRTRKGPWIVTFKTASSGDPQIVIHQPGLGVKDVSVAFTNVAEPMTNLPSTVLFDSPQAKPGFGELIYHDLMYLPGVVTLELYGHQIELLPRALIIGEVERPWTEAGALVLGAKPAQNPGP